jgi:hypothetical protein
MIYGELELFPIEINVKLVKKQIKDIKEQYSVHVYNKEELRDIDNLDIQLTIDDQLFLDRQEILLRTGYNSLKGSTKL